MQTFIKVASRFARLTSLSLTNMSLSLLERGRSRRAQQQAAAVHETPRSSSPDNLTSSPNPFVTPSLPHPEPAALATRTNQLRSLGERALKKVKLDSETEAEFRTYLEVC